MTLDEPATVATETWRDLGERLRVLNRITVLRGLPRERLRELAPRLRLIDVSVGDTVCVRDAPVDRLFAVHSGRFEGLTDADVPTDGARYTTTVWAVTPARLWVLSTAEGLLPTTERRAGLRLDVREVSQRSGRRQTLHDVSLTIEPGELVAIVGGSGAGKTTLLDVIAGVRPPAGGTVHRTGGRIGDPDDSATPARSGSTFGYVPQDDIVHHELSLARTLRYAARLRLPEGTTDSEINDVVREVLGVLDLTGRAKTRVGSLSGGERKRASIAVELLTRPKAFYLDEPTSGLDPATAAELMRLLRRLADGGTTVVLTTHNPPDVAVCDKIAFLAADGYLTFFGPPGDACAYFQTDGIEEIYERLADEANPGEWGRRFAERADMERSAGELPPDENPSDKNPPEQVSAAAPGPDRYQPDGPSGIESRPGPGAAGQWRLLVRRELAILTRNRLTLAILIGSPVMVLAMFVVLFQPGAFDPTRPSPGVTVMILFWIAFGGFFFGLTYGLPQICTEFAILRRERLVGLRLGPYVLAKATVLLPLLGVVDAATLGVLRELDRLPEADLATYGSLFGTLLLCSAAALALGLLTSAAVANPAQAALALPMLCFPQVLFVGAILPVPAMAVAGRVISYAMSNRWAFEGLGHDLDVERLWARGGSPLGPPLLESYGDTFSRPVAIDWAVLGGCTALFLALACVVLARKCRPR